jgi:hypothetical protein
MSAVPITFRRPQWSMLLVSLVIAVCLFAMVYAAASAVTGRDALGLPDTIEKIDPVPAAVRVPSQTSVFVDLLPGYEGVLIVDGLELPTVNIEDLQDVANKPGQQITLPPTTIYEPGNATLTFDPAEGAEIESFSQGEHIVKVIYWKIIEGRNTARSFTWTFNVF